MPQMRKYLFVLPILLLTILLFGIACSDDDDDDGGASGSPTAAASATDEASPTEAPEPEILKIGVNMEITGPVSFVGVPAVDAIELAVQEINDAGGLQVGDKTYMIELVIRDAFDAPQSAANVSEMILDEGIKFIIGPLLDTAFAPAYPLVLENDVWMATNAIAPQADLQDKPLSENPNLFIFSGGTEAGMYRVARALTEFWIPELAGGTITIVSDDNPSSILAAEFLEAGATEIGLNVTAIEEYPREGADFSALMTRVKSQNPDLVYFVGGTPGSPLFLPAVEQDVATYYAAMRVDWAGVEETGIGPIILSSFTPLIATVASSQERYDFGKEVFGDDEPDASTQSVFGRAYYMPFLLAQAIEAAGTVDDVAAVSAALEGSTYSGVLGTVEMNGHFVEWPLDMLETADGVLTKSCLFDLGAGEDAAECRDIGVTVEEMAALTE